MSQCTIEIKDVKPSASMFMRKCECCGLEIENQFLMKCPRCMHKLELANLCMGCLKSSGCHGK